MRKLSKRILAMVLTLVLIVTAIPLGVFATDAGANADDGTALKVETTNDFGEIINNAIETQNDFSDTNGYGVSEITMNGKIATVRYSAPETAKLIVAVYDERNNQMVGSGVVDVIGEEHFTDVEVNTVTMPEYYVVKGFLLDSNNAALCPAYTCNMYTKLFEKFLEKTTDDFDSEMVLNFDDDKTTNFAVMNEGTVKALSTDTQNTLIEVDEENDSYVIKNVSDDVKNLKAGDMLYLTTGDGENDFAIIKVTSIAVSGDTVTIKSETETLTETFEYIKIDMDGGLDDNSIENAVYGDAHTLVKDPELRRAKNVDEEETLSKKFKSNIKYTSEDGLEISGGFTASVSIKIKVFYDVKLFKEDYFEYRFTSETNVGFEGTVEGKIEVPKDKVKLEAPVTVGPFVVKFKIYPEISFSLKTVFSLKVKTVIVQQYDPYQGERKTTEKDKDVNIDLDDKYEIQFGIGVAIEVTLANLEAFKVKLSGGAGIKIEGSKESFLQCLLDDYHLCDMCINGEVKFYIYIGFDVTIQVTEKLKWSVVSSKIEDDKIIGNLYLSMIGGKFEFGTGKCPHKLHKVTFYAKEFNYDTNTILNVSGVEVYFGADICYVDINDNGKIEDNEKSVVCSVTDENGVVEAYYFNGGYTATANKDGYNSRSENVAVNDETNNIYFAMVPVNEKEPTEPTEPDNPIEPTDPDADIITGTCGDNLSWSLNKNTGVLTISGTGEMTNYSFNNKAPWYVYITSIKLVNIGNGVTTIGDNAFYGCRSLISVIIPDNVIRIGGDAFRFCYSLTSITIPDSVTSIGHQVFASCNSLTSITIGNGVTSISDSAFYGCGNLINITIPNSVKNIGSGAFEYCDSLTSVTIGNGVSSIGGQAFGSCDNLIDVYYGGTEAQWNTIEISNGNYYLTNATIHFNYNSAKSRLSVNSNNRVAKIELLSNNSSEKSIAALCNECVADNSYILLNVSNYGADFVISADNLMYIDMLTADENGAINAQFIPKTYALNSKILLIGDFGLGIETRVCAKLFEIRNTSQTEIKYGDSIILHADVDLPEGAKVVWKPSNDNFSYEVSSDGKECSITPVSSGDTTFTAYVVDANDEIISEADTVTMTSKAGFFQKIIAFFKKLFGLTKTYTEVYKGLL